jgi:hypothetical protein
VWREYAGVLGGCLAIILAPASAGAEPLPRFVDYLYVDANEGGSAGGHTALRLGDQVFHYEYRPPGILIARRDTFDHFRFAYGTLENRTIEISRIPVAADDYDRVLEYFSRGHLIRGQQMEVLEQARSDRRILEQLIRGVVEIEGAGFFIQRGDAEASVDSEPAIAALRRRVEEQYGPGFLDDRLAKARRELAGLVPDDPTLPTFAEASMPPPTYTFPDRYRDTLTIVTALEVLHAAPPLDRMATVTVADPLLEVRETDQKTLEQLTSALTASLVRLLHSERPDWGFPLLLGMARLATLDRARHEGRWIFLDGFPGDAEVVDPGRLTKRSRALAGLVEETRTAVERTRAQLATTLDSDVGFPEVSYTRLEEAGNRFIAARRALDGAGLRVAATGLRPSRPAVRQATPLADPAMLQSHLAAAEAREQAVLAELRRLYGYHLITRNCVTELSQELERALVLPSDGINPAGPLDFIPFVSAMTLGDAYPVSGVLRIPSARRADLEHLYETGNPLRVYARESNVVTSTLYHRNPHDSIFLFFTDDLVITRPIFGAVNLLVGLGASMVGLALWPAAGGATVTAGLKGMLFSLPELFFQNIRKGSYEFAPER